MAPTTKDAVVLQGDEEQLYRLHARTLRGVVRIKVNRARFEQPNRHRHEGSGVVERVDFALSDERHKVLARPDGHCRCIRSAVASD